MERNYEYTPIQLQDHAKGWFKLYELGMKSSNVSCEHSALCCLMFALEFYLKAYLCATDKKISLSKNLKKAGHNFYDIAVKIKDPLFKSTLNLFLQEYDLYDIDPIELRYPKVGTISSFHSGLFKGNGTFMQEINEIFTFIDNEITNNFTKDYQAWRSKPVQ